MCRTPRRSHQELPRTVEDYEELRPSHSLPESLDADAVASGSLVDSKVARKWHPASKFTLLQQTFFLRRLSELPRQRRTVRSQSSRSVDRVQKAVVVECSRGAEGPGAASAAARLASPRTGLQQNYAELWRTACRRSICHTLKTFLSCSEAIGAAIAP